MEKLQADELRRLVRTVFPPLSAKENLAILVDIPNAAADDTPAWQQRRAMAYEWYRILSEKTAGNKTPTRRI